MSSSPEQLPLLGEQATVSISAEEPAPALAEQSTAAPDRSVDPSLGPVAVPGKELAPMLQQYVTLKKKYKEHLLLFQVGDFFEIFFEDAPLAADALQIRLTSRNKDEAGAVPMCGVPIHALDNYLPRLLKAGFSVVIISQIEESRSKKGMMQREVTRVVTPGVRFEGDGLDEKRFNYLAALLASSRETGAIAFVDVSTGWLRVQEFESTEDLSDVLRRVRPVELLLPSLVAGSVVDRTEKWYRTATDLAGELGAKLVYRPFEKPMREGVSAQLAASLSSGAEAAVSELARLSLEGLQAVHSVLGYVDEVSFGNTPKISQFTHEEPSRSVLIDASTRRNLEITETRIDGERKNSLLSHIDYTKTAMGSRLLGEWILTPSADREEIENRLDAVEELVTNRDARSAFRDAFRSVRDIDRLVSRITGLRAVPRDFGSLRDSLAVFPDIASRFGTLQSKRLTALCSEFDPLDDVFDKLKTSLVEDPPMRVNEGDIFRPGFHPEVDRLRTIGDEGHTWLVALEQREREKTGISSLKVKFNNVFGYFLEVTKAHLDKIPKHYERRQTLVNAERFVIPELKEYESQLLSAKARRIELEKELFIELRQWMCEQAGRIQRSARCLSILDVLCSFAHLAEAHNYTRPKLRDDEQSIIIGGRHPVIERVLGFHQFIPNDTKLDSAKRRFAVLTGPNMGGKSTYLRQVGLIQLLAQAGSFVPAQSAELGIVDRIFTRIGAADDLARGDSTFMVEMREAATILRKATKRSLVLIDEIGRGTATRDGLSLATAIAEWLHDVIGCRTVFATHFHELTELEDAKEGAFCLAVGVIESGDDISFTHRIEEHAASKSYGIEVARLAGLPEPLLKRAGELLAIEHHVVQPPKSSPKRAEPAPVPAPEKNWELEKIVQRVERCRPDSMTPIQALVELSEIKEILRGGK